MEKKPFSKFLEFVDKWFPSASSLFYFWMMLMSISAVYISSLVRPDITTILITCFSVIYCFIEYMKAVEKGGK
jgi:hypothetical protein